MDRMSPNFEIPMDIFTKAISVLFVSFIVGIAFDGLLRRWEIYEWISTRYLFSNPKRYERLGVLWFRKFLFATPLRYLNQQICVPKERSPEALQEIRKHMATVEVSHWGAFGFMLALTAVAAWYRGMPGLFAFMAMNVLGNLYPCLLQQYNKRRLVRFMGALERRHELDSHAVS
jgi:hypothetical protein